jgi:hypothetical protein
MVEGVPTSTPAPAGSIVSTGVIVAVAVAKTFWREFLRKLARRGLPGGRARRLGPARGLKAAVARVLHAPGSALSRARLQSPHVADQLRPEVPTSSPP